MEFEDKNLKAVVKKAAKALKVPEETLQYEVISYGSTGIFGLVGAKKAKIRVVTAKKVKTEQKLKTERGDAAKKPKGTHPSQEKKAEKADEKDDKQSDGPAEKQAEKPPVEKPVEKKPETIGTDEAPASTDISDDIEKGRCVIQKIVDRITDDATVRIENKDEGIVFHVEGGKTALIIGKRGQTLEAIQYLVDRIVNKDTDNRIRFQIDVAGYLENKRATLEQRALHLAEKARKTGKPVTVGELNVYDRKIVHICLKEDHDVRTQSMGSGFYRKLVIFPKKGSAPKNNNS